MLMGEVVSFLSHRNYFGAPYLDKEHFKKQLALHAGIALDSSSRETGSRQDALFTLEFENLGFSRRLKASLLFTVNMNDELNLVKLAIGIGDIHKDFPITNLKNQQLPTLKEMEDGLLVDHRKHIVSKIDRKHLRRSD